MSLYKISNNLLRSAGGGFFRQPSGNTFTFPLATGAPYTQRMAMQAIFPRPDSDGDINSWERQKMQPAGVPLRFPIGVQGGVRPFRYSVQTGPSGMTIGTDLYTDWGTNRFQDYGVLKWSNPTVGTHSITVRITDQGGNNVDVSWDLVVASADDTSKFMWFDATNGNDSTGAGTKTSPYKTDLTKAFGSTTSSTTFQGHVILKAGSYDLPVHSSNNCELDNSKRPVVCYAAASTTTVAETVVLNGTAVLKSAGQSVYSGIFFGDMEMAGGLSSVGNWRFFDLGAGTQKRITFWRLNFTNPPNGSAGNDNATSIFFNSGATSDSSTYDNYVALISCTESGRASGATNAYGLICGYGLNNVLLEDCYFLNGYATEVFYLKDSCRQVTVALSYGVTTDGPSMASGCQNQNGGTSDNMEWVHCRAARGDGSNNTFMLNHSGNSTNVGSHWVMRCTIHGVADVANGNPSLSGTGPYVFNDCVVKTSFGTPVPSGTTVTNTGTECQGSAAYTDSNFNLIGTYRTNYLALRGYEFA